MLLLGPMESAARPSPKATEDKRSGALHRRVDKPMECGALRRFQKIAVFSVNPQSGTKSQMRLSAFVNRSPGARILILGFGATGRALTHSGGCASVLAGHWVRQRAIA